MTSLTDTATTAIGTMTTRKINRRPSDIVTGEIFAASRSRVVNLTFWDNTTATFGAR